MKIAVIGTGYVGLVAGVCFAEYGFQVLCIDSNSAIIEGLHQGIAPIFEPGLEALMHKNYANGNLQYSANITDIKGCDVVILAVGTPSGEDGNAQMHYLYEAIEQIAPSLYKETTIIIKSTVPVGTAAEVEKRLLKMRPDLECNIISNPEFLREGMAIQDFINPDRIVIGFKDISAKRIAQELYKDFAVKEGNLFFTDNTTAELIKYASNAFLATKIAFINEIADMAEKCSANIEDVSKGIGMDHRISPFFLNPGPGYGGSCFPKDTLALSYMAQQLGVPITIVDAVINANNKRKKCLINKIITLLGESLYQKRIAILGLAFKANTDDMRESPAIDLIEGLINRGAIVTVYDPQAIKEARKIFGEQIIYCKDALQATKQADIVAIVTEWEEFKKLNLASIRRVMRTAIMVDYRNLYTIEQAEQHGFVYSSIGR